MPTYYQHNELTALGSKAIYVLCVHGYHQFSLVGTVTVVDECGRTVVSHKTWRFCGVGECELSSNYQVQHPCHSEKLWEIDCLFIGKLTLDFCDFS